MNKFKNIYNYNLDMFFLSREKKEEHNKYFPKKRKR